MTMKKEKEIVFSTFRGDMCNPAEYYVPYKEASAGIKHAIAHADEQVKEGRERIVDHLTWLAGTYHDTRDKDAADALSDAVARIERGDHLTPPTGGEG
jgi:hypothetical protein